MNEVVADTWTKFNTAVFKNSLDKSLDRYRSPYVFRGLSDSSFQLLTSLQRLRHSRETLETVEQALLRNFEKYSKRDDLGSEWRRITIGQHFGLPTRLLDWSFSPLVALHFATCDLSQMDRDAAVWCLNVPLIHSFLPSRLGDSLAALRANVFPIGTLEESFPKLDEFHRKEGDQDPFVLFFEPPSVDERIVNQVALFSLLSDVSKPLDVWLQNWTSKKRGLATKIIIPAAKKWEYRDRLDQLNITERVLFPGLDGLSDWLRRWYSPKR
ncbi:FRG domain-containing protein [Haloferula helveola]|uniref:FRG domain-containing protein n=1 Tax=Haloferula helveola TaxID=490095 RepID=A0ABN6H0A5_9BACT|nr:FRG domain-containing protein [Haloferula helveola]